MAKWKESTIFAVNMGKLIYNNKWRMIKPGTCHMIRSSALVGLINKEKARGEAFAKLPSANMQHQQTRPNLPKYPKDDKKYRFSVMSHEQMLIYKLCAASSDLKAIYRELDKLTDLDPLDLSTLRELDSIIVMVMMSFYKITPSSNIGVVEDDDFVTKEDDDSVSELKDNLKDNAFVSRELMLIDKLSEAAGDLFKIYHKLLIIKKDMLTLLNQSNYMAVHDLMVKYDTISGMIVKSISKIGYNCDMGDDCICNKEAEEMMEDNEEEEEEEEV